MKGGSGFHSDRNCVKGRGSVEKCETLEISSVRFDL